MHIGLPIGLFIFGIGVGALVTKMAMSNQVQRLREDVMNALPLEEPVPEKLQPR